MRAYPARRGGGAGDNGATRWRMRWWSGIPPTPPPTGARVRPELSLFRLLNIDRNIPEHAMYSFWRGPHASTLEGELIGQETTTRKAGRDHVPDTR